MKNFSSKRRGSFRRNFNVQAAVAIAIVLLAVALVFLLRGVFGTVGGYISVPLYHIEGWIAGDGNGISAYFRSRAEMEHEIEQLKETIRAKSGSAHTIERLLFENEELRKLAGAGAAEDRIAAGVIARPPHVPYDALLIDRGTVDGIVEGAVVYFTGERAIGTIARAFDTSAVVNLFSTPFSKTTAYIVGPNIYTTAYGAGGGVVRVSVPQGILLAEGDLVLLPGIEGGVLGKISAIESEPSNPEQNAYIVHDVPLQSLRLVSVTKTAPPTITFEEARVNIEKQKEAFLLDVPEGVLVDVGTTSASSSTSTATTTE